MSHRIPHRLGWTIVPPQGDEPVAAYLLAMPDGDPQALRGTAALIWTLAAEGETDVAASLADLLEVGVDDVRADVDAYLDTLVEQRLLERAP